MKRIAVFAVFVLLFSVLIAAAQGPPPKPTPAPELKKLDYFVGTWKTEGEFKPGSMGPGSPGGKFTELGHNSWMAGHFFLAEHTNAKSDVMGNLEEIAYLGYNTEEKVYTYDAFNSMGEAEHAKGTVEGDTWTWTSTEKMGGQTMKGRFTITVASPTSYTFKFEIAPENSSNYTTIVEGKSTKVVAAAKGKEITLAAEAGVLPITFLKKQKATLMIERGLLVFNAATTYSPTHFRVQYNRPCGA